MADTGDDELKKKFQQLQQQQHQKLEKRKRKKKQEGKQQEKQQEKAPEPENAQLSKDKKAVSFGVEDELDLKVDDPLPKSSSYLSAELVEHLNEQIRELKDENGRLFKLLGERDYEIRQLKRKREEDKIALTGSAGMSGDTAASKIVELSKKVRELNAALETKKTEAKQLFGRCRHLENEIAKKSDNASPRLSSITNPDDVSPRSRAVTEAETKLVTEKLRMSEQRNSEYRNQVQGLKTEIKMAQKVIANEVGEGVNFHDLLNANSNWRGRAQQILGLQKKVGEMKLQLEQQPTMQTSRSNSDQFGDEDIEAEFMGAKQSKGADMKHREALRRLEKEKKEQQERAAAELKALEGDYSNMRQKLEAGKARNKVLANENKAFRAEMQKLIDKGAHDDELVSALIAQQASMKTMIEQLTALQKENQTSQQDKMSAIAAKNQQENNIIHQLKSIVAEKEGKVKQLEQELIQLRQAKIQESQMNSVNALFDRPATSRSERASSRIDPGKPEANDKTFPSYDNDDDDDDEDNTKALNPSPPSSGRNNSGRASSRHGAVKASPMTNGLVQSGSSSRPMSGGRKSSSGEARPPSQKSSSRPGTGSRRGKVEPKSEEKEELERQCQEYKSLAQAAEVERDKLMELIKVLQKRLDDANESSMNYQNEMKAHKQNAVQLEKLIGKMKLENSPSKSTSGVPRMREKSNVSGNISLGSTSDLRGGLPTDKLSELESSLTLQRDENVALKAALESTIQAKEEDLKLYNDMMEQTKLVFLQGLRQIRGKTS